MNYIARLRSLVKKKYLSRLISTAVIVVLLCSCGTGKTDHKANQFVESITAYPVSSELSYMEGAEGGNAATDYQEEEVTDFFQNKVSYGFLGEVCSTENVLKKQLSSEADQEYYAISILEIKILQPIIGKLKKDDIVYVTYPHMLSDESGIAAGKKGVFLTEIPKQSIQVEGTGQKYETIGNLSYGTKRYCLSEEDKKILEIDSPDALKEYWVQKGWVTE